MIEHDFRSIFLILSISTRPKPQGAASKYIKTHIYGLLLFHDKVQQILTLNLLKFSIGE